MCESWEVKNVADVAANPPWKMQIESPIKFCPPYKGLTYSCSSTHSHVYMIHTYMSSFCWRSSSGSSWRSSSSAWSRWRCTSWIVRCSSGQWERRKPSIHCCCCTCTSPAILPRYCNTHCNAQCPTAMHNAKCKMQGTLQKPSIHCCCWNCTSLQFYLHVLQCTIQNAKDTYPLLLLLLYFDSSLQFYPPTAIHNAQCKMHDAKAIYPLLKLYFSPLPPMQCNSTSLQCRICLCLYFCFSWDIIVYLFLYFCFSIDIVYTYCCIFVCHEILLYIYFVFFCHEIVLYIYLCIFVSHKIL